MMPPFLFATLGLLLGCDKSMLPDPPPDPCEHTNCDTVPKLEIVWKHLTEQSGKGAFAFSPYVHKGQVLYSVNLVKKWDMLRMRDGKTGNLLWEWEDPAHSTYFSSTNQSQVHQGNIYLCTSREVTCVDLNTGTALWKSEIPKGVCAGFRINIIGDYVYHERSNGCDSQTEAYLVRSPLSHPQWDTLFTLPEVDGYRPSIEMPSAWVKPDGDTLLIFQGRTFNFDKPDGKVDLYALNLRTRTLEWKIDDLDRDGNSNVAPPTVWRDRIYFQGDRFVYCIEAPTGKMLWKHEFTDWDETLTFADLMVIEDNKLIVKPGSGDMYAFDPLSGKIVWHIPKNAYINTGSRIVCHKGILYFCGGSLFAVDAANGKVLWNFPFSPMNNKFTSSGVAVNPELGLLYTSDSHWSMAVKLIR